jgi:hypothetical protein
MVGVSGASQAVTPTPLMQPTGRERPAVDLERLEGSQ